MKFRYLLELPSRERQETEIHMKNRIWKVEMDDGLYKVKLSNGLELEITRDGRVIDIDD